MRCRWTTIGLGVFVGLGMNLALGQTEGVTGKTKMVTLPGGVPLELVWVEGGTFRMGCSEGDSECEDDEATAHQVTVDGFWMGKHELTQRQWRAVMSTEPWLDAADCINLGNEAAGAELPVYCVSWDDARDFLSQAGQGLRLPTEAEWEHAARGGTEGPRYGALDEIAWFADNSGRLPLDGARLWIEADMDEFVYERRLLKNGNRPRRVGGKAPNRYGLHDMLGNVWEWCSDWYGDYSSSSQRNPTGPSSGQFRVARGGSWADIATRFRASQRGGDPGDLCSFLGLRVARSAR